MKTGLGLSSCRWEENEEQDEEKQEEEEDEEEEEKDEEMLLAPLNMPLNANGWQTREGLQTARGSRAGEARNGSAA